MKVVKKSSFIIFNVFSGSFRGRLQTRTSANRKYAEIAL